jgi:lysophospholipase L1-like esterase
MATTRRALLGGAAAGIAAAVTLPGTAAATRSGWVASWATGLVAPTPADAVATAGFTDTTVRQVLRLSAGSRVRIRFGNPFGTAPITVGPVTAARPGSTPRPVTFGGRRQATLASGAWLTSDPVDVTVPGGTDLVVSTYLPGPTGPVSFHRNAHATNLLAPGDQTAHPAPDGTPVKSFFLIGAVEVDQAGGPVLAILGDSITEGVGTPDDANLRFPDQLARRLATGTRFPAIANLGISGNRVLLDDARFGQSGQSRFDRDVLSLPNLTTLLVYLGINDVQQPPSQLDPGEVLAGYRQLTLRARDHHLRVLGATIAPFEGWQRYTPELNQVREAVNAGIRTGRIFDHVVDVDAALRDPAQPTRLRPAYSSGDGLHPNAAGAAALAAAVDRRLLF